MEIKKNSVEVELGNIIRIKYFRLFVENYFPINKCLKIKLGPSTLSLELQKNI